MVKPPIGGSATDLYKGTPADPSLGLPKGAIDNGDGTYTVGSTTFSMENDTPLYTTDANGKITLSKADSGGSSDDEVTRLGQEEGLSVGETIEYDNGTTITALDDGNGGIMYVRGGYDKETGLGPKGGVTRGLGDSSKEVVDTVEGADGTVTVTYADGSTQTIGKDFDVSDTKPSDGTTTQVLSDGSVVTYDANGDFLFLTGEGGVKYDAEGAVISDSGLGDDTIVADATYYQDDEGNYYTMNADGGYDLAYYADGSEYSDAYTDDTAVADNTYTDPDTGAEWTMADNGEWTTDFNYDEYYANEDYALADNSEYTDDTDYSGYEDYQYAGNDDYSDYDYTDYGDYDYAKRGGLITMMKNGGVPHFEDGGEAYMPYGAEDNGDGTFTIDNEVFDMETGEPLYMMNDDGGIMYVEPSANSGYVDNDDGTYTLDGITYDMYSDMPLYTEDAKGNIILAEDNGDGTYNFGNETFSMGTDDPLYTTNPRTGGITVDPNVIRNSGSGNRADPTLGSYLNKGIDYATKLGGSALDSITGALGTTAGAAGAGALIATLLGQDFSGGTGDQNQGLDMSKVGVINPRTTDFGIGPTNFVGYDQYGTDMEDYTPNEELLRNLNAPGYNPVNEGDYGYEEVAPEETAEEVPEMASGGLSSMATPVSTYYTFGQPADIMANLGMRPQPPMNPPEMMAKTGQPQQQGALQQAGQKFPQPTQPQMSPPQLAQQMPHAMTQSGMMPTAQGMAPPMRKGGLPHVSNVPLTQGRMDFRRGAAVHGEGDGQSDDIPAMLADGEYVIDAETVAQIGNGSTKAGAQALDKFREGIRAHKRSAPVNKIPPKTKPLTSYLKGAK